MCYLIAKKYSERGCIAVQTESGKHLAALVSYLGLKTLDQGIQILTLSNPDVYGEYGPYRYVSTEQEFITEVFAMCQS